MHSSHSSQHTILLRNARVVTRERVLSEANLLIEDGRITSISEQETGAPPSAALSLDLNGELLLPGLIDIHIHGSTGVDTMVASADDLHRVALFLAQHGVTSWLPTLVPAPLEDYQRTVKAIEKLMLQQDAGDVAAARALGLHYEGPFINSAQCGALRPAYFQTFTEPAELDKLAVIEKIDAKHLITVAPEIEGGIELVGELRRRGWIISIGHTRSGTDKLEQAQQAGAHHMTHFMNAMPPLHHRSPGPIGWGLMKDEVSCDVIADGVHIDPLMLKLLLRVKTPARLALISDAIAPAGLGDGAYQIWGETITVTDGRTSNARGNIAGSVITLLDAVRMMLSLGVPAWEVALMAAGNPARLLGISEDYGSIEEGKRADLFALDAEGNVRLTIIGGRIAFDGR